MVGAGSYSHTSGALLNFSGGGQYYVTGLRTVGGYDIVKFSGGEAQITDFQFFDLLRRAGVDTPELDARLLAEMALSFSTYEYFWLAFLGLMCATLVARSSPIKAIASMLLGLLFVVSNTLVGRPLGRLPCQRRRGPG